MATVEQPAAEDAANGRPAVRRAAVIGTGTMGPGMGAVLARAGIAVAMYDVSEEALDRSKAGVGLAEGVLDQLETPRVDGGSVRYTADLADALDEGDGCVDRLLTRPLAWDHFDHRDQVWRVRPVRSHDTLRVFAPFGDLRDRNPGRIRGEDRVDGDVAFESPEDLVLDLELLRHSLEHEVDVLERVA